MKIAVAKEIDPSEKRVAVSPDTVKKFRALGAEIAVEPGAGSGRSRSRSIEVCYFGSSCHGILGKLGAGRVGLPASATSAVGRWRGGLRMRVSDRSRSRNLNRRS